MTRKALIGIVCGSGINLDALLDSTTKSQAFADFPSLPDTAIIGHKGLFVTGSCDGIPIILQCGRLHSYEGHPLDTVVAPTNALHSMGARSIIFTNAAGGLNEEMKPGDLLAARSLALWPCVRWQDPPTSIDTDFRLDGCDHEGMYTWIHGPCYETPAEIRALQSTGSDAVGMSTAPEIARCHQLGIRAASISCITNNCCSPQTLTHEHVLEIAAKASLRICEIIRASLHDIHA